MHHYITSLPNIALSMYFKQVPSRDGGLVVWWGETRGGLEVSFISIWVKNFMGSTNKNLEYVRCGKCDRVGMVGLNCNKRDCKTKFHRYLILLWDDVKEGLSSTRKSWTVPPSQLPPWPAEVLAMQNPLDWHRGGCKKIEMNCFSFLKAAMVERMSCLVQINNPWLLNSSTMGFNLMIKENRKNYEMREEKNSFAK